jgi:hypothetical protein
MQPSGRAFEGVQTPRSVLQINIEDVRTSEQHHPDVRAIPPGRSINQYSTRSLFSEIDTVWEASAIRPDDSATRPDDVQYLQTVQTT